MGITTADRVCLLDLTRLTRRAGRAMTGIDRVEAAYLHGLAAHATLFGLVRTGLGYILLGPEGCARFAERLADGGWGSADGYARLVRGIDPMRARAEADMRRLALARTVPLGLSRMLRRHLPAAFTYFNVGHTRMPGALCGALRAHPGARVAIMVHDTIPLDHPEWVRPGMPARFARFLDRATGLADVVVVNSDATGAALRRHLPAMRARCVTAPLGVTPAVPKAPPEGPWTGRPYFVCVGTIEARKDHALLLDIWPGIPAAHLLICGARGWRNDAVLARLDARPDRVHELHALSDGAIAGLTANAAALLMPSRAEGFGLPVYEAAALGTPVLCSDLPVYREGLGDIPIYLPPGDRLAWGKAVAEQAHPDIAGQRRAHFDPPGWTAHFKTVLTQAC